MSMPIASRVATLDQFFNRMGGSEYSQRLAAEVKKLSNLTVELKEVFDSPDPTQPNAAHIVRIAKASGRLAADAERIKANMNAIVSEGLGAILTKKMAKVPLVPDKYAAEIRERVRTMSAQDLMILMLKLATENKASELAAITEAPAILTGVSDAEQQKFREMIFSLHAQVEQKEEEQLLDDYDAAILAYNVARATADDHANDRNIAAILNAQQRAEKADAGMAQAFNAGA